MRLRLLSGGADAIGADELAQLLDVSPAVLSRWREDRAGFHPVWVSPNLEALTGWTEADMLGDRGWWVDNVHPEDRGRALAAVAKARSGERHRLDYRFHRKHGGYATVHDEFRVIESVDGKPRALVRAWSVAAEREATAIAEHFRAVADAVPFGVMINSFPDGRVLYLNAAMSRLTGYSPAMLDGASTPEFYADPSERGRLLAVLEHDGVVPPMEFHARRRDGSTFWAMFSASRIVIGGQAAAVVGFYDIDRMKRTERELRDSDQRFRAIADTAPFGLLITSWSDGRILYANEAAAGLAGYSPAGILAKQSADFAADPTARERYVEDLKRDGVLRGMEFWARRPDGTRFWAAVSARMIEFDGEPAVLIGAYDITGQKRLEEALRDTEQRFRDYAESASDWYWEMDADLRFSWVSDSRGRSTGFAPAEPIGKTRWELAGIDPAEEPWIQHRLDLLNRRPFRDFRYGYPGPDGRMRYYRVSGAPVFDRSGRFQGYRGVGTDETVFVEAEHRAAEAQARLASALESTSEAIVLFDANDRMAVWNRKFQQNSDRLVPNLIKAGMSFEQYVRDGARRGLYGPVADVEAYVDERLRHHRNLPSDSEICLSDGTWLHISQRRTADGGTIMVGADITDLKRVEQALRESEQRFRDFTETASDWWWETDAQHRAISITSQRLDRVGLMPSDVTGRTRWEIIGADVSVEPWRSHVADMEAHRPFRDFCFSHIAPDGRQYHIRISGKPVFAADGRFLGYRGVGTDETAKVEAERRAAEAQAQLAHALESMSESLLLTDAEDRVVLWNRRGQDLWDRMAPGLLRAGITFEQLVRDGVAAGFFGPVDDAEAYIARRMADHRDPSTVREHRLADGTWMQVSERRTADGGMVVVQTDITARKRAEDALQQSKRRFRDFAESASDWFWETDADLRFTWISGAKTVVLPIPLTQAVGKTRWEVLGADASVEPWRSHRDDMLSRRPFRDFRYSYTDADGRTHHYRVSGVPVVDEAGRFQGYRGNGTDETARIEAEHKAAQAQARLLEALESTSESFALFDAEDRLVLWNRKYQEIGDRFAPGWLRIGITFEELVRENAGRGLYAGQGRDPEPFIQRRLAAHRNLPSVSEHQLGDGTWVQVTERRTADGGTVLVQTDISEIKRREAELRKLSRAVEQSPAMVVITDTDGRIEYVNPKFSEVTGYGFEEAVGRTPAMLKSGSTPREIYKELWATLLSGRDWIGEIRNQRKTGEVYWCRESISPLRDGRGVITHYVAVEQDISAERQAEAELRAAKEQAELANRAKSEFLANMSHELRTPLNAIIGFSEVIRNELFGALGNERYRGYIDNILESGNHLLSVINDILDIAKIEAGKLVLTDEELNLGAMAESAVRLVFERARQGGLELVVDIPDGLPALRADARSLKQILLNLLSNAVKFTGRGGRITLQGGVGTDGGLWLSVTDTGIGIAPADVERVFEPFYQAEAGNDRRYQGTGLGLPLCKRLAEAHGGRLELNSRLGAGTTVTVSFPPDRTLPI